MYCSAFLTFTLGAVQPKANLHTRNYLQMDPFDTEWVSFHCRTLLPAVQARSVTIFKTFLQEPTTERSGRTCPAVCPCTVPALPPQVLLCLTRQRKANPHAKSEKRVGHHAVGSINVEHHCSSGLGNQRLKPTSPLKNPATHLQFSQWEN